jgi:hypothetical protein
MTSPSPESTREFKTALGTRFRVRDLGRLSWFLSLSISRDRQDRIIMLSQAQYVEEMLERYDMAAVSPTSTPLPPGTVLHSATDKDERADANEYRSIVGSLMYASTATRPDIAYAVSILSRHCSDPTLTHRTAARHVLAYLSGSADLSLALGGRAPIDGSISAISDSDDSTCNETRLSVSGGIIKWQDSPVSWFSQRGRTTTSRTVHDPADLPDLPPLSSTEAEIMAASETCRRLITARRLCADLGVRHDNRINFAVDSTGAIGVATAPSVSTKMRHVSRHDMFVRALVQSRFVKLQRIDTKENPADVLTKSLPLPIFRKHRHALALRPTPIEEEC